MPGTSSNSSYSSSSTSSSLPPNVPIVDPPPLEEALVRPVSELAAVTPSPTVNPARGVYNFLCDSCKNNGKLRGWIYVNVAMLTVLGDHIRTWMDTPPKNGYEVSFVIILALVAGFNALRSYLDQHISDSKTK